MIGAHQVLETVCKRERGERFFYDFLGDVCTKFIESWKHGAWSVVVVLGRGHYLQ
jgi:hypothetical protein